MKIIKVKHHIRIKCPKEFTIGSYQTVTEDDLLDLFKSVFCSGTRNKTIKILSK